MPKPRPIVRTETHALAVDSDMVKKLDATCLQGFAGRMFDFGLAHSKREAPMTYGIGIRCSAILAAAGVALMMATGPSLAQKFTMKIGFVTIHDSQHESAKMFKAEIEKRTNGAIEAKIFPLAQLGRIPRQLEGIQLGRETSRGQAADVDPTLYIDHVRNGSTDDEKALSFVTMTSPRRR